MITNIKWTVYNKLWNAGAGLAESI